MHCRLFRRAAQATNESLGNISGAMTGLGLTLLSIAHFGYITNLAPDDSTVHSSVIAQMGSTIFCTIAIAGVGALTFGKLGNLIDKCTKGRTLVSGLYSCITGSDAHADNDDDNDEYEEMKIVSAATPGVRQRKLQKAREQINRDLDKAFSVFTDSDDEDENGYSNQGVRVTARYTPGSTIPGTDSPIVRPIQGMRF